MGDSKFDTIGPSGLQRNNPKYQMWMTGNSNAEPPEPDNDRVRVVGAHFVTIRLALKSTFD
jgi:hypothetical protein